MRISGVRVFDGERVLPNQDVAIDDGVITRVTAAVAGSADVDGRGRTLLPGLFDAHVHLAPQPEAALRQLAESGVTTALDMFSGGEPLAHMLQLRQADPAHLAALRTAGTGATAPGNMLEKLAGHPLPTVHSPAVADAWVDERLHEGADFIKIVYDVREGGPLDLATVRALVDAAHARGVLAVAHTIAEPRAREAIAAGVDGLAHLFIGDSVDEDFGQFAADHGVFVVPTLIVLRGLCGHRPHEDLQADRRLADRVNRGGPPIPIRPADPSRNHLYAVAITALRQLAAAGVPVLAGTDTGLPTAALGVFGYGATLHAELELLVEAGLSPIQALVAATSAPARAFRLTDRGRIRPGMRADLVLVNGDPTQDIRDTRNLVAVWKRGACLELAESGN
ncbi:amidohydrolase [Micromonospora globispora]|uniref:amidohydrolase family protein n=1 Tax=Micromonospora globispora TaxID=1450148 RepID=UPI000D6F9123|nr:amidohydrolase family protein [Micromonospora globispora]PWU59906.1 amidohydrolase [Micromonospora globispora]